MRVVWSVLLLLSFACSRKSEDDLVIATAANVQFAMEELAREFEKQTGIHCEIILGSSGQLNAQIKAGAPYDVFVSAHLKYVTDLFDNGYLLHKPITYANGVLVLWSRDPTFELSIPFLESDSIKKVAIANPSTAPYGEAASQALRAGQMLNRIKEKIVYGESISQVNQFVMSKAADVGFTAKSVVISSELKSAGKWIEIDPALYDPIEQGAGVIKGRKQDQGQKFLEFLQSENGKMILSDFGYRVDLR